MNDTEITRAAVERDLGSSRFISGPIRKRWRKISYEFPLLIRAVAAVETDGKASNYAFRFELTGFPRIDPEVRVWDCKTNTLLRLTGGRRIPIASARHLKRGETKQFIDLGMGREAHITIGIGAFPSSLGIQSEIPLLS